MMRHPCSTSSNVGPGASRLSVQAVSVTDDHFGALFRGSRDAVLVADRTGRCIEANPAAEVAAWFRARRAAPAPPLRHRRRWTQARMRRRALTFLPGDRWRGEIEVRGKDGVLRRVEAWSMEVSAPPGAACALFLRSAGDRSETEEAGARLFAIVASSTEAIIGTTLDGTITHWNPAAERLYGYRADEAIGRSVAMLAPPELANDVVGSAGASTARRAHRGVRDDAIDQRWLAGSTFRLGLRRFLTRREMSWPRRQLLTM